MILFQSCNSYFALFYIAFVKSQGLALFESFGLMDWRGRPYEDSCGQYGSDDFSLVGNCSDPAEGCRQLFVRGDCMTELSTLMLSHLILKPLGEVAVQIVLPWLQRKLSTFLYKARLAFSFWMPLSHPTTTLPLSHTVLRV